MKLHANAALSLRQRERMVLSGGRAGWSITEAAEAAGVSERTVLEVGGALPRRGRGAACWIAARRRSGSPTAPRSARSRRSPRCGGCGSPARRSPSCSRCRSRRSRGSSRGSGWASSAGSGLEPADRYERERPGELIHIDVKKLGRIAGGAGKRVTGGARSTTGRPSPTPPATTQHGRLGIRPRRDRRRHPPGLRRSPRRREGHDRDRRSCAARSRSTPATASPSSA